MTDSVGRKRYAVLHVGCNPVTGPLTQMVALSRWQTAEAPGTVFLGIAADREWFARYSRQPAGPQVETMCCRLPRLPSSLQYLLLGAIRPVARWIERIYRETGLDGVVVHFHTGAWRAGVYLPLPATPRCGAVITFRGFPLPEMLFRTRGRRFLHRCFARQLVRHDPELVSVDRSTVALARPLFNLAPERFTFIANGIETPAAPKLPPRDASGFVVGYVGQLHEYKGYALAMEAVRICRGEGLHVRMCLAGDGPDRAAVEAACRREPDAFEFAGYVAQAKTALIPRFDLLVLPSANEGMPNVVLEAMAAGVPVLATAVGAVPDLIDDGWNGFLVPRRADAIADRLRRLVRDPVLRAQFAERSRARIVEQYSIQATSNAYRRVYEAALDRRAGSRGGTAGRDRR